jgi:hypothetical protein
MDLKETRWESVSWIRLAQDKNVWMALVNVITNLQVQQNMGHFLKSRELLASEKKLFSMEFGSIYIS